MIRIIQGDCLQVLKKLQPGIINACVTSPPYYGLRNYGTSFQIGQESSPEHFIAHMVRVFREVKRLLRRDGTLWLNLGDSYWGSGQGNGHTWTNSPKQRTSKGTMNLSALTVNKKHDYLKPKDLIGIPWRVALALQRDGWYLRSDVIWAKSNPMTESVKDRPTKSHEYFFMLTKSEEYYYDYYSIREPQTDSSKKRRQRGWNGCTDDKSGGSRTGSSLKNSQSEMKTVPKDGYRNKRTVWTTSTAGFRKAHFATFPPKLIEPCILASCPKGGIVLDPFSGAATTGLVAAKNERNYIGVEMNPNYVKLSKERLASEGIAVD